MWRSALLRQSSYPEVMGSSPADGRKVGSWPNFLRFVTGLYPWLHISSQQGDTLQLGTLQQY